MLKEGVGDKWVWVLESSGEYFVKSAYKALMDKHIAATNIFLNRVWNKLVPLKVSAFAWKLAQDKIPS